MTSQRFCLRWNNHQSNLLSVFDQLLQDESFVDVTLAVDGRNLKAHKIVLSACSPYFQALFVGHPDRHPIVILKDIPYVDMRSLLDFMYRGEVSVDQDRLTMFLKVAESLRIKGLTEASGNNCDNLAKMGSTLTGGHPSTGAMSMYQQRLKRPLSASQHSLNSLSNNPLLGSALAGPKRKRGLPRKLSGSLSSGLDMMPDMEEAEGRDEEAFDDDRSVQSDSDMIERAHSPFDNKMLEVNVSEVKAPRQRPPSSTGPDDPSNVDERGEERRSPSPEREDEGEREGGKQTPQDLAANIKMERDADAPSGGDQNERNSSPVPERFPPGYLQHLLKLKSLDISKRVYENMLRSGGPPGLLIPGGEMPKDLSKAPSLVGPMSMGYPGSILAGFPPDMRHAGFGLMKPSPTMIHPGVSEENESRNMSNVDDKFYEDMISCSDEDVEEECEESTNNNDYDVDMRKFELSSYKMLERSKRREEGEGSGRMDTRTSDAGGISERFPRTSDYRGELGELTIETSAPSLAGMSSVMTRVPGTSPSGRSRKQGPSQVPFSTGGTSSASTSATSPRDRSFIDKASVRQFCTQEGEHIFRCNICLKTYTHISNFCRHFLSAHDDRYKQEISCPVCFKMFTRRDNMMTHTKQVHRITLMRGTLQPVYLDGENGAAASNATTSETSAPPPPPPSSTATSTS